MKRYVKFLVLTALILSLTFALFACNVKEEIENEPPIDEMTEESTDDSTIEDEEIVVDPNNPLSPETMRKINAIYAAHSPTAQTVTTVQQLAILTSISYTIEGAGPISITPATLNSEDITLITLGGTEFVEGQATGIEESKLASFGESNDYLTAVVKLFEDGTVPSDKPVLITGISLGGMIAQQLIGEPVVRAHEIRGVITFGSPLTMPMERNGIKVVRFTDKNDMVPKLGETSLMTLGIPASVKNALHKSERIMEISKYRDMVETHALSYIEDECWDKYDFMGDTNKKNELVLLDAMTFYPAPKLSK